MGKSSGNLFGGLKSLMNMGKMFGKGGGGWIFGLILLASLFKKKKKPQAAPVELNYESPTYSFGGGIATTISNDNSPIPLVFGKHMIGGNIVNSFISSNSLLSDEEIVLVSSTEFAYVTHDQALGYSIHKIIDCPTATTIDIKFQVPFVLFNTGTYLNRAINATVLIEYSYDQFTWYTALRCPLMNFKDDGYKYGMIYQQASNQNPAVRIPVHNDQVRDVYIKATLENYTVVSNGATSGFWVSNNQVQARNILTVVQDFIRVTKVFYTRKKTIITNTTSNQRLYMDVVLSAGEIRNLRSVYVNDRPVADFTQDNRQEGVERSTQYRFRPGFDSYADANTEGTLNVQSTVYNQNDVVVGKTVGSIVSQDLPIASNTQRVYFDDMNAFTSGTYVALVACATDDHRPSSSNYVTSTSNDYADFAIPWGAYKAGQPLYISDGMPPYYIDFQYTTQTEQVDSIVVGLNAPEGLYNTNTETGGLYNRDILITIRVAPATLASGTSTSFPLSAVSSTQLLVNKQITLRGAKRNKIWFDQFFKDELIPNPVTGEKKYLIEIRKDSDNTLSDYSRNGLQVAYVEELVNKELAYNGCAYCGMEIIANSKINSGTPNLKFEVDGMLLPLPIHPSIIVNTASSTNTSIVTEFNSGYGTATNYIYASGTSTALNGVVVEINKKLFSLLDDQSVTFGNVSSKLYTNYNHFNFGNAANSDGDYGWPYFKAYFKCGDSWYRRFVTISQQRVPTAPLPPTLPEHLRTKIDIIVDFTDPANDAVTGYYLDTRWLAEQNTPLPSVPTDVMIYQWSNNPAWIILFLLCDENNGAGIPFENIDLDSFKEAAAYFDEYIDNPVTSIEGDLIKRCAINYILDSYSDLRTHIEKILTICHGALYNSNNKIKFLVERLLEDSEFTVSLSEVSDIIEMSVTTIPTKELPNQLVVSYMDENNKYEKKSIVVEDASLSKSKGYATVVKSDMDMFGLTNESHVLMESMRIIKGGRYTRFAVQLKTALSGLPIEIYDGFKLTAPTYGWVNKKFRCIGIKISDTMECDIDAIEYYDEVYELETDDLIKYHEVNHTQLPSLTDAPDPVKNIVIFEEAVRNNDGSVQVNLVGNYTNPQEIVFNASGTFESSSRYEYNRISHVFVTLYRGETASGSFASIRDRIRFDGDEFRFNNLEIGKFYKVAIEAASLANAIGAPAYSTATQLEGKILPPLSVTSATWTRDENDYSRYVLAWEPNTTDFDMANYRVRFATSTGSWTTYEYQLNVPFPLVSWDFAFFADQGINYYGGDFGKTTNTNFQIMLKCVDTSGNESEDELTLIASATLDPDNVTDLTITSYNSDDDYPINITWVRPTGDNVIRYEVKFGTATATWENAQYTFNTKNTWLYLDHGDIASLLASQTGVKVMVKGYNFFNRVSTGASATKVLTLAPTTEASGTLELSSDGVLYFVTPDPPTNKDFLLYQGKLSLSADPEDAEIPTFGSLASYANTRSRILRIPSSLDNTTFYLHYRAMDKYFYTGAWNSDFSMLVDVIPAAVSSTQMKYKVTNNGISLLLPDKSQELSWDYYDVHISSSSGFTPELNSTSTSRVAVGKTNKFEINQFNDGTALNSAATYYIKVRSLSKYAPTTETYHSAFNTADLEVVTSDATSPIIIVDAITPSISPINVIIGDTLQIDYTVTDNGTIDRTRGRVYHVDHLASATWTDPITSSSHTFDLFPTATDGNYVIQLQVFDTQGNYSSYTNYFSRDTATASAPASVSATQINTTGIQVTIEAPTGTINIKEYVVEYAVDTGSGYGAWAEIRRTNATTFVESLAIAGTVKFRVKTTKIHTATLDSGYTESAPITMDSVGPSLQIDYTTPDIFLDSLLTSNDVTFHFLTSDSIGLQAIDPVKFSLDSGVYTTSTTISMNASGTEASGTVVITDLADGSHYITFRSYDEVGNTKDTMTYYFEIDTAVPADLDTPTIAVNGRTITITVPDFTPDANFKNIEYQLYNADTDAVIATFNK